MYKVSILIPIYGVEQYIERCSRSLFEQSYQNLEFVFINDYSPDQSIEILKRVIIDYPELHNNIRIIDHDTNRGLATARNTGLDYSHGEFVICVDSDDWLESKAIEWLVNEQLKNDADIVLGQHIVHYFNKDRLLKERIYLNKEQMTLQMMQHSWDHFVTGNLFRRSLFVKNQLRWKDGLDVAEDRYIMTLLAYYSDVSVSLNKVIYHYERRNNNALTSTNNREKIVRNNNQELNNLLCLEQFFSDKEELYKRECSRCVLEQLYYNYRKALDYDAKEEFYNIAKILDSRQDDELCQIKWKSKGIKGYIMHHYFLMKCYLKGTQIIKRITNKLNSFFR